MAQRKRVFAMRCAHPDKSREGRYAIDWITVAQPDASCTVAGSVRIPRQDRVDGRGQRSEEGLLMFGHLDGAASKKVLTQSKKIVQLGQKLPSHWTVCATSCGEKQADKNALKCGATTNYWFCRRGWRVLSSAGTDLEARA